MTARRRHYFGAQTLPLHENRAVCLNCGLVVTIGKWPQGKRRKCSPGHSFAHAANGATARLHRRTGRLQIMSKGHP